MEFRISLYELGSKEGIHNSTHSTSSSLSFLLFPFPYVAAQSWSYWNTRLVSTQRQKRYSCPKLGVTVLVEQQWCQTCRRKGRSCVESQSLSRRGYYWQRYQPRYQVLLQKRDTHPSISLGVNSGHSQPSHPGQWGSSCPNLQPLSRGIL